MTDGRVEGQELVVQGMLIVSSFNMGMGMEMEMQGWEGRRQSRGNPR